MSFEPFVPRRIAPRNQAQQVAAESSVAADAATVPSGPLEPPLNGLPPSEASPTLMRGTDGLRPAPSPTSDEPDQRRAILAEALRIAEIACLRILKHALDEQPRLIEAFVADAFAAAGSPEHARIGINSGVVLSQQPACAAGVNENAHLLPGEVTIESNLGTLSATLEERAHLVVRAIAAE